MPALPRRPGMRIVKADQANASLIMQREGAAQSVRPFRGCRHLSDNEFDPKSAFHIRRNGYTVKVEEDIQTRVASIFIIL
jgi:hypothetical protein